MSAVSDKHVFLTGFMGTGKSTVGRILADRLGRRFVDLDACIVADSGLSIPDIFARHGETYFRDREQEALGKLATKDPLVVATGGGVVLRDENRRLMRESGIVINLTASVETVVERLRHDEGRPLLREDKSPEKVMAMLAEREQYYQDAAVRIDTTGRAPESIAEEILVWLK
ncbi:shikimate kinase [Geobacter sp. DSM 9736]|uniref:shikimate kinase n=1 Tax=Geobacter sp. DSM 9736 TaxID=1277350 RepID=UPI000B504007|nr:shikimate kinase [Geobacter sp. DSM 9736]SNB46186.1 shikimate kinase [Geobacter sp. DSM 9736]